MKKPTKIMISVVILILAFLVLNMFLPIHKHVDTSETCKFCGVTQSTKQTYMWYIPVRKATSLHDNEFTVIYATYIDEPHEHEWIGRGSSETVRFIYRGMGIHADGVADNAGYPFFPHLLTGHALTIVSAFGNESIEFRREMFHNLLNVQTEEDFVRVQEIAETIRKNPSDGVELYNSWVQEKTGT